MDDTYDIDAQANYEGLKFCPRCAAELEERESRSHRRMICTKCSYIFYMAPAAVTCVLNPAKGSGVCRRVSWRPANNRTRARRGR